MHLTALAWHLYRMNIHFYFLFFLTLLFSEISFSQSHFGTASGGAGKTGRAAVEVGEGIFLNPASIAHFPGSSLVFGNANSQHERGSSWGYRAVINDNQRDKLFPASIAFVKEKINIDSAPDLETQDVHLGVAHTAFGHISFGVSYHYFETILMKRHEYQNNFNVGVLYTPFANLGLGLVAYDVLTPGNEIDDALKLQRRWGAGMTYLYNEFIRVHLDASGGSLKGSSRPIFAVGGESYFSQFWALRAGVERDPNTEVGTTGVGIGFIGPRFQLQYAYQTTADIEGFRSHSVDFSMPF